MALHNPLSYCVFGRLIADQLVMVFPSAMPLFDEHAFVLEDTPEAGDSEASEDEKNSDWNIACGETMPGEMWDGDV
jgi:hypothetical protein